MSTNPHCFKGDPYTAQKKLLKQCSLLRELYEKILAHGGQETLFCPGIGPYITDAERDRLLTRGRYWPGTAQLMLMESCQCHQNSKLLWKQGVGELVNGYALSTDGLWRPHSWVLTPSGQITETTVLRAGYFGVVLKPEEIAAEY